MTNNDLNAQADEGDKLTNVLAQMQAFADAVGAVEIPLNSPLGSELAASLTDKLKCE